jgi:hypothetical protein
MADRILGGGSRGRRIGAGAQQLSTSAGVSEGYDASFSAGVFATNNIGAEYQRLKGLGVTFRGDPKSVGPVTTVPFEDRCGNLIMLVQPAA